MDHFLASIKYIDENTKALTSYTEKYKKLSAEEANGFLMVKDTGKTVQKIETLERLFKQKAAEVKNKIELLHKEATEKSENIVQSQIRMCQWLKCSHNLSQTMEEFRKIQVKHSTKERTLLKARLSAKHPNLSESEIERMVNEDSQRVRLDEREKIKQLTHKIEEILVMLNDLDKLINDTGGKLEKIEVKMGSSRNYVEAANRELEFVKILQIRNTFYRKIVYIIVFATIMFFVLVTLKKIIFFYIKMTFYRIVF